MPELLALADGPAVACREARAPEGDPAGLAGAGRRRWTRSCGRPRGELAGSLLASKDADEVGLGIEVARDFQFRDALPDAAGASSTASGCRRRTAVEALKAIVALDPAGSRSLLARVLGDAAAPRELRENAAMLLANQESGRGPGRRLEALPTAPARLQTAIAAAPGRSEGGRRGAPDADRGRQGVGPAAPGAADHDRPGELGHPRRRRADRRAAQGPAARRSEAQRAAGSPPRRVPQVDAHDLARGRQGLREELRHLPPARRQGGEGRPAARRHRQPRPRPAHGRHPRPQPQRRPELPRHQPGPQERPGRLGPAAPRGGRGARSWPTPRARRSASPSRPSRNAPPPSSRPCRPTWPSRSPSRSSMI